MNDLEKIVKLLEDINNNLSTISACVRWNDGEPYIETRNG